MHEPRRDPEEDQRRLAEIEAELARLPSPPPSPVTGLLLAGGLAGWIVIVWAFARWLTTKL